ncbi:hypothetical protein PFISCL1PPCAC_2421, partial [Pristionchus fissidentatus]
RMEEEYVQYELVDGEEVDYVEYNKDDQPIEESSQRPNSTKLNIKGRTFFSNAVLFKAIKAVIKGNMNVNKAANFYGVPRSSLQRKVAQSREEHKRSVNEEYLKKLEAKAQKEREESLDEETIQWRDEYQRRIDEVEANVAEEIRREEAAAAEEREKAQFDQVDSECIIEENVDPSVDNHIYLDAGQNSSRRDNDEDDDIPPPPQIGLERGSTKRFEEEVEVVADELEEREGSVEGMPRLDCFHQY